MRSDSSETSEFFFRTSSIHCSIVSGEPLLAESQRVSLLNAINFNFTELNVNTWCLLFCRGWIIHTDTLNTNYKHTSVSVSDEGF